MSKNQTQINIFAFDNYRDFLKAFYEYKKSLNSRYSYRVFCNKAGISSTSYLNMIMHGKRNLTQKSIPKFVKGLSLKGNEKKYFENLVLYNQSTDQELRSEYFQRLLFLRSEKFDVYKLGYNQHAFLSKWYAVAIYEFLDTKNNCHSAKLIADKLKGGVTEEDVKDLMCKAGQPVSLETKVGDGEDTVLLDLLAGGEDLPDEQIEMDCMRGDLHSLLHQLPDLQCRVLRMRYGMDGDEPMSLTGIGRVLGISRDRVRNLERDGLRGLRRLSENVEAYFIS